MCWRCYDHDGAPAPARLIGVGIVYHYTDTQAFKGVIEKAALWATDFRYLNDSGELVYTWAAFVKRLEQLVVQPGDHSQAYRAQLEALSLMNAKDLMQFDDAMFVACFTELRDAVGSPQICAEEREATLPCVFSLGFRVRHSGDGLNHLHRPPNHEVVHEAMADVGILLDVSRYLSFGEQCL